MPDGNLPNFLDSELSALEERFLKRLAMFDNLSYSEKIQLATELDFFKELESAGLTKVVDKIELEYSGIIRDLASFKTQGITALTLQDLDLVLQLDQRSLLRSAESYASQFQSRLIKGFIAGEQANEIEKDKLFQRLIQREINLTLLRLLSYLKMNQRRGLSYLAH
ncbi:MAG: hypothetical protein FD188_3382 [Ignavibacteria bacterium]|nr:MAG: hypothetical protein FD188_3382 [Ignavibacteria bacterium]